MNLITMHSCQDPVFRSRSMEAGMKGATPFVPILTGLIVGLGLGRQVARLKKALQKGYINLFSVCVFISFI